MSRSYFCYIYIWTIYKYVVIVIMIFVFYFYFFCCSRKIIYTHARYDVIARTARVYRRCESVNKSFCTHRAYTYVYVYTHAVCIIRGVSAYDLRRTAAALPILAASNACTVCPVLRCFGNHGSTTSSVFGKDNQ